MQQFTIETHIGADGILHLNLPVAVKNTDLKVHISCNPISLKTPSQQRTAWDAIQKFREQLKADDLTPDEDIFANVRDRSTGREIDL